VDEARMAVEEAMLALLDAIGAARPNRHQPQDLFNALIENGMAREAEEIILAAPRFRGRTSAGHAGRPRVTPDESRAAVAAAASGLLYLASRLPSSTLQSRETVPPDDCTRVRVSRMSRDGFGGGPMAPGAGRSQELAGFRVRRVAAHRR
jgi:hypothetical protein